MLIIFYSARIKCFSISHFFGIFFWTELVQYIQQRNQLIEYIKKIRTLTILKRYTCTKLSGTRILERKWSKRCEGRVETLPLKMRIPIWYTHHLFYKLLSMETKQTWDLLQLIEWNNVNEDTFCNRYWGLELQFWKLFWDGWLIFQNISKFHS